MGIDRVEPREEEGLATPAVKGSVEGGSRQGLGAWEPGLRQWALEWSRAPFSGGVWLKAGSVWACSWKGPGLQGVT